MELNEFIEIVLLSIPTFLLFIVLIYFQHTKKLPLIIFISWVSELIVLFLIGIIIWENDFECTRIAEGFLFISSVVFVGPFLIITSKIKNSLWILILKFILSTVLTITGIVCTFIILAHFNVIWGM